MAIFIQPHLNLMKSIEAQSPIRFSQIPSKYEKKFSHAVHHSNAKKYIVKKNCIYPNDALAH